jgi:HK97 family phage major capsid protein
MKSSIELKELRSDFISKLEVIKEVATAEERDLTQEENTEMDSVLKKIDDVDVKIERAERSEKALRTAAMVAGTKVDPKEDKDLGRFSFQEAMRQAYTGKISGIVKEMDSEARGRAHYTGQTYRGLAIPASILTRAQDYVDTTNQNSIQTMSFTDQLQSNLVLASAGANFYGGVENMKFPVISGITSDWQPETGGSEGEGKGTTTNVELSPKKVISIVNISAESLAQNSSLEAAMQRNMAASVATALESALLSKADVTNAPQSIFLDANAGSTAAVSAATIIGLETDVLDAGVELDGSRMAYLMDVDAYKLAKTVAQVSSVSPLWDNTDKRLNGYYGFVSNNVASDGAAGKEHVLFGDFSKVHICQFGGIDMLFDPFTTGGIGIPRMIITSLVDGDAVQNTTAFSNLIEA